jgi:hypothetical protein
MGSLDEWSCGAGQVCMCVSVCVCICMIACMCVCMCKKEGTEGWGAWTNGAAVWDRYVCVCICMCLYMYDCMHVCMYVYQRRRRGMGGLDEWSCSVGQVCMCVYMYVCMCMKEGTEGWRAWTNGAAVWDRYVCVCLYVSVYV